MKIADFHATTCGGPTRKGCGRPIVFALNDKGTRIPLDPAAPVYRVTGKTPEGVPVIERVRECAVSHFATCSMANHFSGANRRDNDTASPTPRSTDPASTAPLDSAAPET